MAEQLNGAGQVVEILGVKEERTTKIVLATPEGSSWKIVLVQDEEKKK